MLVHNMDHDFILKLVDKKQTNKNTLNIQHIGVVTIPTATWTESMNFTTQIGNT